MGMKKSVFAVCACLLAGVVLAIGLCVQTLLRAQTVASDTGGELKILIDAGHGGIDGGVTGRKTGAKESDLNLAISLRMHDELTDRGYATVLTRKTEAGLYDTTAKGFKRRDMQKRKAIVEEEKPAFLVSVHQNFYPSKTTRGAQVFYEKGNEKSRAFALALQNSLNALYGKQGVKARKATGGDFFILKCTENPSVIVECGFLSNADDEALLTTPAWQKKLAVAIADGLADYLSAYVS